MLKLVIKIAIVLALTAGVSVGIYALQFVLGPLVVTYGSYEISRPSGLLALLLAIGVALTWLIFAILRRGLRGVLQSLRSMGFRRRERGFNALAQALVALAEGDGPRAMRFAARAERLVKNPDLTRLVNAQAAKLSGDDRRAEGYYEAMADDPDTDFVGVVGLMRQALKERKLERARRFAERAHQLRPRDGEVIDTLFDLQRRKHDWAGARNTLAAAISAGRLPRDVGERRRAVLHVAEALDLHAKAEAPGAEPDEASAMRKAALEQASAAIRLSPGFVPAAALAAKLLGDKGETRNAVRAVTNAWRAAPHPDLAAAFDALGGPDEPPSARRQRFERLFSVNAEGEEARLLAAEFAVGAGDPQAARRSVEDLLTDAPSTRAFAVMAAIEQIEGAGELVVRGWLSRAASAPRGPQWVCAACGGASRNWSHTCRRCGAFDSIDWTRLDGEDQDMPFGAGLLPMLTDAAARPMLAGAPAEQQAAQTQTVATRSAATNGARNGAHAGGANGVSNGAAPSGMRTMQAEAAPADPAPDEAKPVESASESVSSRASSSAAAVQDAQVLHEAAPAAGVSDAEVLEASPAPAFSEAPTETAAAPATPAQATPAPATPASASSASASSAPAASAPADSGAPIWRAAKRWAGVTVDPRLRPTAEEAAAEPLRAARPPEPKPLSPRMPNVAAPHPAPPTPRPPKPNLPRGR